MENSRLFEFTNVFSVHLTFAPDQWEAMEPKGGFGSFGPPAFGGTPATQVTRIHRVRPGLPNSPADAVPWALVHPCSSYHCSSG